MTDLQSKLEAAIRETLHDKDGAGSDLSFIDDIGPGDEWLFVEGNLDVRHLASHVIDVLGLEYEYNVERTSLEYGTSNVQFNVWFPKAEADEMLAGYIEAEEIHEAAHGYRYATYRLVKRRKAGEVEDA